MALTPLRTHYRGHRLVAMRDEVAGQNRYYHFDHQGTTQCLTDQAGTVTDRFASNAWGVPVKRTGTSINRQWYIGGHGYYRQPDRPVDNVRMRWRNPHGAWLSADPVQKSARYRYAANSPVARIDPSGLRCGVATHRGCDGPNGWWEGHFTFCPPHFDLDSEFGIRTPTVAEAAKCSSWFFAEKQFALLMGYEVTTDLYSHWYSGLGADYHLTTDTMNRLLRKSPKDRGHCNDFASGAAATLEVLLPRACCDPPGSLTAFPKSLRRIWYRGQTRTGILMDEDADLYWGLGGHRAWSHGFGSCTSDPGGDLFSMNLTYQITDGFRGHDWEEYMCHKTGIFRDYVICGKGATTLTWRRGRFKQSHPSPCDKPLA